MLLRGIDSTATGAQIAEEHIWFNVLISSEHRALRTSTMEAEKAAVAWAENGVMRLRDVMNGTNLITRRRFAELYPKVEEEGMLLELRNGFPKAWDNALRDGTAPTWGADCLPPSLLGDDDQAQPQYQPAPTKQKFAIPIAPTLRKREPRLVTDLRAKDIYYLWSVEDCESLASRAWCAWPTN